MRRIAANTDLSQLRLELLDARGECGLHLRFLRRSALADLHGLQLQVLLHAFQLALVL